MVEVKVVTYDQAIANVQILFFLRYNTLAFSEPNAMC